ncbi:kiSS-1 receptor-like [Diadema antillarum]|uniref:kiSS-1 receptor-like n=1 Tax=Diadema antillarum TaxID=105358 RepID=UPI003A89AF95
MNSSTVIAPVTAFQTWIDYVYEDMGDYGTNYTTNTFQFDIGDWKTLATLISVYTMTAMTIGAIGVVLNLSVLVVIMKERSFHTETNYFIFNLALADTCYMFRCIIHAALLATNSLPMTCSGWTSYIQYVCCQASSNTLLALSLSRYDAIVHPLQSLRRWNKERVKIAVVVSWAVAFILQLPSYFLQCTPTSLLSKLQHIYVYAVMFPLPALLLVGCYARITSLDSYMF